MLQTARTAADEMEALHTHFYPGCKGGCRMQNAYHDLKDFLKMIDTAQIPTDNVISFPAEATPAPVPPPKPKTQAPELKEGDFCGANYNHPWKVELRDICPRPTAYCKKAGITPTNSQGAFHARINPGENINIHGVMTNHIKGPQSFDRVFKIGDRCEYDSYNLKYLGTITGIGPNTVTVQADYSKEIKRLWLWEFIDRNWNFDLEKIEKHNQEESNYL
jgi:hypothetical protein